MGGEKSGRRPKLVAFKSAPTPNRAWKINFDPVYPPLVSKLLYSICAGSVCCEKCGRRAVPEGIDGGWASRLQLVVRVYMVLGM